MSGIEVIRTSADRLTDQVWRFEGNMPIGASSILTLRLWRYAVRSRPTTRHKMSIVAQWDRMDQRSYNSKIRASEVPMPDDVVAEAKSQVVIVVASAGQ